MNISAILPAILLLLSIFIPVGVVASQDSVGQGSSHAHIPASALSTPSSLSTPSAASAPSSAVAAPALTGKLPAGAHPISAAEGEEILAGRWQAVDNPRAGGFYFSKSPTGHSWLIHLVGGCNDNSTAVAWNGAQLEFAASTTNSTRMVCSPSEQESFDLVYSLLAAQPTFYRVSGDKDTLYLVTGTGAEVQRYALQAGTR